MQKKEGAGKLKTRQRERTEEKQNKMQSSQARNQNVPGSHDGGDEELGAVRVTPGVGHGEETRAGVRNLEVLIGKLGAVGMAWKEERKREKGA